MLKKTLGEIIFREISDPSMGLITVSDVRLSPDLREAKVYFTVIGGQKEVSKQINIVKNLGKFLRRKLSSKIVLKYVPKIQLIYDDTPQKAQKIDMILKKIEMSNVKDWD